MRPHNIVEDFALLVSFSEEEYKNHGLLYEEVGN